MFHIIENLHGQETEALHLGTQRKGLRGGPNAIINKPGRWLISSKGYGCVVSVDLEGNLEGLTKDFYAVSKPRKKEIFGLPRGGSVIVYADGFAKILGFSVWLELWEGTFKELEQIVAGVSDEKGWAIEEVKEQQKHMESFMQKCRCMMAL